MTLSVKDGGTWKDVTTIYVKDGGTWKQVVDGYVKTGGVWTKFTAVNRVSLSYTFASNTANASLNLSSIGGYQAGTSDITITVNADVYLYATSTGNYGLNITGGTTGDTLTIVNNGFIMGQGGVGGTGYATTAAVGGNGGPALNLGFAMSDCTINNTYSLAYIAGGGGGGGGGNGGTTTGSGGGGGGGSGGGTGGTASNANGSLAGGAGGSPNSYGGNGQYSGGNLSSGAGGGRIPGGSNFLGTSNTSSGGTGFNAAVIGARGGGGGGATLAKSGKANVTCNGGNGYKTVTGQNGTAGGTGVGAGGGGGFGAAGGTGGASGGSGGQAVNTNGKTITWTSGDTTRVYGAVS